MAKSEKTRLEILNEAAKKLDEDRKAFIIPLLSEIAFMEEKLKTLKAMPYIVAHPKNPNRVKTTDAAKQYKETMQIYLGAVKTVLTALYKIESSAADELMARLQEFEL